MRRFISVLAAAVMAAGALGVAAFAAKEPPAPKPFVPTAEQVKKGKEGAPDAIATAKLACTMTDAYWINDNSKTGPDKKVIKTHGYEVSCSEGTGWVLIKGDDGSAQVFDCVQIQDAYAVAKNKETALRCRLPANQNFNAQMQVRIDKAGVKCTVSGEKYIGSNAEGTLNSYEVSCNEGGGYVFVAQIDGTVKPPATCLAAAVSSTGKGYECSLTPKAQQLGPLTAMAASVDKSCTVSSARWVGLNPEGHEFTEVACTGKPGFFLETNKGAMVRSIDCTAAVGIGGGCKLSDATQVRAQAASNYSAVLKKANIACTPEDINVIGRETSGQKRDVVEIRCPERAWGLVAYIPGEIATAKFDSFDCIGAEGRGLHCKLTPKSQILANLKPILAAIDKVCEPTDYKVTGPGSTDGDLVEVKCTGAQDGYVLDLPQGRAKTIRTLSCTQAARGVDKCEIEGNH